MDDDLTSLSQQFQQGERSSTEITSYYLERIAQYDQMLSAFITVCEQDALSHAKKADVDREQGIHRGALQGIPIALKDLFHTKGVKTTAGSSIRADFVPQDDAFVWQKMQQQGAILLGKTNLHEFAYGTTSENPHYGPVHNPWNLAHSAGGSSGGSAAAIAASLTPASIGTDTGGSVRIPAACTGTYGLKPTRGLVSLTGIDPLAMSLDHAGPMGRSVRDIALLLSIIAGYDEEDPYSVDVAPTPYSSVLGQSIRGMTVGIDETYYFARAQEEVITSILEAKRILEDAGAHVIQVAVPGIEASSAIHDAIISVEALTTHHDDLSRMPEAYGDDVRERLLLGRRYTAQDYAKACRERKVFRRNLLQMFDSIDILLTPTLPFVAPPLGQGTITLEGAVQPIRNGLSKFTRPFNTAGFPAIAVPCGLSREHLPLSVQFVARPFAESQLLKVSCIMEQAFPFFLPPLFQ